MLKPENFSQGHLPRNDTLFRDAQPLWDAARNHGLRKGMTQCLMLPNRALGFYRYRGRVSVIVALQTMKWSSGCSFWYGKACLYWRGWKMTWLWRQKCALASGKGNIEMDGRGQDLFRDSHHSVDFRKYSELPPEEYAKEIQCAKQNADSLLCRGNRAYLSKLSFWVSDAKPAESIAISRFLFTGGKLV